MGSLCPIQRFRKPLLRIFIILINKNGFEITIQPKEAFSYLPPRNFVGEAARRVRRIISTAPTVSWWADFTSIGVLGSGEQERL
jgi:hypothetical protein